MLAGIGAGVFADHEDAVRRAALPAELIEEVRAAPSISTPLYRRPLSTTEEEGFQLGQRVLHPKFGEGVILSHEGQGATARVQVNFADAGSKWLVIAYANLQPIGQATKPLN